MGRGIFGREIIQEIVFSHSPAQHSSAPIPWFILHPGFACDLPRITIVQSLAFLTRFLPQRNAKNT
jgi:hypothetical protein